MLDRRRQPVDARGEHGLDGGRHLDRVQSFREPERAALAGDHAGLDERPHALLEKERIALGPVEEQALERLQRTARPQQCVEQRRRALGREGIDPELGVVGLAAPAVLVLGAIVDEQQHARRRQTLDEAVEERLRLAVDPVQVLEEEGDRLHPTLAQHEPLDGVEDALPALGGAQRVPLAIARRRPEQREQGRQRVAQRLVQREQLAGDLLAYDARLVALLDLEIHPQQVDHGQIRRRLAVGDGRRLEDEPAVGEVRAAELPVQA